MIMIDSKFTWLKSLEKHYSNLRDKEKLWFNKNVNVVKSVKDIPSTHHQDIVPILLGGFHCLGLRDDKGLWD